MVLVYFLLLLFYLIGIKAKLLLSAWLLCIESVCACAAVDFLEIKVGFFGF